MSNKAIFWHKGNRGTGALGYLRETKRQNTLKQSILLKGLVVSRMLSAQLFFAS
ncbi:MAG: hypothetical protein ACFFCW_23035 [Candidatus Hodarchaeota archaeon]